MTTALDKQVDDALTKGGLIRIQLEQLQAELAQINEFLGNVSLAKARQKLQDQKGQLTAAKVIEAANGKEDLEPGIPEEQG